MNATSGLLGGRLLKSANLQSLLENRLQALTASRGSIMYRLTWKTRVTPLGRPICALRASRVTISASDFILSGWPTATTRDHKDGTSEGTVPNNGLLGRVTWLAGWPTPQCSDVNHARGTPEYADRTLARNSPPSNIALYAHLAGWGTPLTNHANGTPEAFLERKRQSMLRGSQSMGVCLSDLNMQVQAWTPGPARFTSDQILLTGSTAGTPSGGRLNPQHSRWLMRIPAVWDDCAPMATRSTPKRQLHFATRLPEYDL